MGNIVFGPVQSRRFGRSLGVDLSPSVKQCNFDCLYCELEKAKVMDAMSAIVPVSMIMQELQSVFQKGVECDVLTFSANGEPTLYPHLLTLIKEVKVFLKTLKSAPKLLILSNGSLFGDLKIKEALLEFDIVKFSLDAVSPKIFKRVDRAIKGVDIATVIDGIKGFKECFNGDLVAEVLLVKNVNDSLQEVQKIADTLRLIQPTRVDLGSIDRPAAYVVEPLSYDELKAFLPLFEGLCVLIPNRKNHFKQLGRYNEDDILQMLKRRPLNNDDLLDILDESSLTIFKNLESQGLIRIESVAGIPFYRV